MMQSNIEKFNKKMEEAREFFKQLDQLTRQSYGIKATYDTISLEEKEVVRDIYIKYGGDLNV